MHTICINSTTIYINFVVTFIDMFVNAQLSIPKVSHCVRKYFTNYFLKINEYFK